MRVLIQQIQNSEKQTIGNGYVYNDDGIVIHQFSTLELPWKDNQRNISRIPNGIYDVIKRNSKKFGDHFHVLDVPNRSYILLHSGNFYTDIRGCILVGEGLKDINKDSLIDVIDSRMEMKTLNLILPTKFKLHITNALKV